jgi:predicted nucleic acid-binding Zn ribbon protein
MTKPGAKLIGGGISSVLTSLGIGPKIKQYEMLEAWPEIVGKQIAGVATAERITDGKLFVHVEQAVWRNELVFLKKDLIEKINSAMHQEIVHDIIFR